MTEQSEMGDDERATRAIRLATRAFGDGEKAASWLGKPNGVFGGRVPLSVAKESSIGCARVCRFLDDLATD